MLLRFTTSGFRGFGSPITLTLDRPRDYAFNTEHVTSGVVSNALVLGRNASGKTNLLDAIADVRTNYYPPQAAHVFVGQDDCFINADTPDGLARFEYVFSFNQARVTYKYNKRRDHRLVHETLMLDDIVVFDYKLGEGIIEENLESIGAGGLNWVFSEDYSSALAYLSSNARVENGGTLDKLRRFTSRISMVIQDGWGSSERAASILGEVISANLVPELETFLRDFGINESLEVREGPDGSRAIYSNHARPVPFVRCMSSGTRTLVSLFYVYRVLPKGTLYLLDEFDAYCHFELAELLIRYFGSISGAQTIATTHNTGLTRNGVMRPDCIFMLDAEGGLEALSERTDRELRFGNNIERLLRNGEFD